MATLFDRTGFNFTDTSGLITTLPNTAINQLNTAPSLLPSPWMVDDLLNNNANGYHVNPVATSCNTIWSSSNTLITVTNGLEGSGNLTALWTTITTDLKSISGYNVTTGSVESPPIVTTHYTGQMEEFLAHTYRISGVVPITANVDAAAKPHLEQAMQIGRALMYLIYQTDGREDNAPMLGSFTSILVANTINEYANIIITYANTINASISESIGGTPPDNLYTIRTSNLTFNTVNTIATTANSLITLLRDRRVHDENFYTNANQLVNDAKSIRRYASLGSSESSLIENLVGSDKLKTRLAQQ